MKIGCQITHIDEVFSKFSVTTKILTKSLKDLTKITKAVKDGKLYKIDKYCMRNVFSYNETTKLRNTDTINSRFFECEECSRFKMYKEMVDLDSVTDLNVFKYENIIQKIKIEGKSILSDNLTNLVLINQYLHSEDLAGIDFPINSFLCGRTGFMYYLKDEKSNIYKGIYDKLITNLEFLDDYSFGFNSLPNKCFDILKSSKKNKSNIYLKIPNNSGITTKAGVIFRNYELFDLIIPGDLYKIYKDYFILTLDTTSKIKKFKYLRVTDGLNKKVNFVINLFLYFVSIEKEYNLNMPEWANFWNEVSPELNIFKNINDYDLTLHQLNGKKLNFF